MTPSNPMSEQDRSVMMKDVCSLSLEVGTINGNCPLLVG